MSIVNKEFLYDHRIVIIERHHTFRTIRKLYSTSMWIDTPTILLYRTLENTWDGYDCSKDAFILLDMPTLFQAKEELRKLMQRELQIKLNTI